MLALQRKGIMKNENRSPVYQFLMLAVFWSLSTLVFGGNPEKSKMKKASVFSTGARVMAKVELQDSSGGSFDKETGIMRWNLNLKEGESASLRFRFKIRFPKNMILDTRL